MKWRRAGVLGFRALAVLLTCALLAGIGACRSSSATSAPTSPPARKVAPVHYVALGDSYAAGPGIPTMTGVPVGCGRSTGSYPYLVSAGLPASTFRDVACGGATTTDLTATQSTQTGPNSPQLDALSLDTSLVTVTIGGNDIGFTEILRECLARSPSDPAGAACRAYYHRNGRDVLAARIADTASKVGSALWDISHRAPAATVLVVGYPTILPTSGAGCSEAPLSAGDIAYLNQTFDALNTMLRQRAAESGARYVDTASGSVGHDVCAAPGMRWVEGRNPTSPAAAFHPNALGMRNMAQRVLDAAHSGPP